MATRDDAPDVGDPADGDHAPSTPPIDPFADTGPVPVVIGPFPADHHTHVLHGHPHEAPPAPHVPPRHAEPRPWRRVALVGGLVTALVAVGGVAAYAMSRTAAGTPQAAGTGTAGLDGVPAPGASTTTGATTGPSGSAAAMLPASAPTLVLGDSLGLAVYPYLADLLPDRYVSYEAEVGRSTTGTARALGRLGEVPPVVIVSSGTNDPFAAELETTARQILDELGSARCVVWVDVVRPDRVGDPAADLNAAIERAATGRPHVSVLHWSALAAEHPEWITRDGIHPNDDGARARAQAFADAAAACSPIDTAAPRAKRQVLPQSAFTGPISGGYAGGSAQRSTSSKSPSATASATASASSTRTPSPSRTPSASSAPPTPTVAPTTSTPTPTETSPSASASSADPPTSSPSSST